MSVPKQRVVLIQEHLPHYRTRFFSLLREALATEGVELVLIHGKAHDQRLITEPLDWAHSVPLVKVGPIIWHRLGHLCKGADLIIVPQEVKYLRCHWLHLKSRLGGSAFAFWGHGRNFQSKNFDSPTERVKRFLSRHVDWWFAYNDLSARVVRELGYPAKLITTVGNAIDTASLIRARVALPAEKIKAVRAELDLRSENVAVYTGGLYPNKRIDFLLETAKTIRARVPDFELIIIGDGPERGTVEQAAAQNPWIHAVGPKNDEAKVPYWALAKLLLMPGGVGLVILDSFALGVPMVTTDTTLHGPEIDYLRDGVNGVLIPCGDSVTTYAEQVAELLLDKATLVRLRDGAIASGTHYSIEKMTLNFVDGIIRVITTKAP